MKLKLDENTLNIYLTEAIRMELNEGIFKGTTYRVIFPKMGIPHNMPKITKAIKNGKNFWFLCNGSFGSTTVINLRNIIKGGDEIALDLVNALRDLGYSDEQILDGIINGAVQAGKWDGDNFTPWPEKKQRKRLADVLWAAEDVANLGIARFGTDNLNEWEDQINVNLDETPNEEAWEEFFNNVKTPEFAEQIKEKGLGIFGQIGNWLSRNLGGVGDWLNSVMDNITKPRERSSPETRPTPPRQAPTRPIPTPSNGSAGRQSNGTQGSQTNGGQITGQAIPPRANPPEIQQRQGPPVVQNPNIKNGTISKAIRNSEANRQNKQTGIDIATPLVTPPNQGGLKLNEGKKIKAKYCDNMKVKLTEETLTLYINEAIKKELEEEGLIRRAIRNRAARKTYEKAMRDALERQGKDAATGVAQKPSFWKKLTGNKEAKKAAKEVEDAAQRKVNHTTAQKTTAQNFKEKLTIKLQEAQQEIEYLVNRRDYEIGTEIRGIETEIRSIEDAAYKEGGVILTKEQKELIASYQAKINEIRNETLGRNRKLSKGQSDYIRSLQEEIQEIRKSASEAQNARIASLRRRKADLLNDQKVINGQIGELKKTVSDLETKINAQEISVNDWNFQGSEADHSLEQAQEKTKEARKDAKKPWQAIGIGVAGAAGTTGAVEGVKAVKRATGTKKHQGK